MLAAPRHDVLNNAEQFDAVMDRMVAAIAKVQESQGSIVSLPKAELDVLLQIEMARDYLMDTLRNQNDRSKLWEVFGGDCQRIARLRALLQTTKFSEMNKGDQRLPSCLNLCQSVEKIVVDLGDGEALRKAHAQASTLVEAQKLPLARPCCSSSKSTSRQSSVEVGQSHGAEFRKADSESSFDRHTSSTSGCGQTQEEALAADFDELRARVASQEERQRQADATIALLQRELKERQQAEMELRRNFSQLRGQVHQLQANGELDMLQERMATYEAEASSASKQVRAVHAEVERLRELKVMMPDGGGDTKERQEVDVSSIHNLESQFHAYCGQLKDTLEGGWKSSLANLEEKLAQLQKTNSVEQALEKTLLTESQETARNAARAEVEALQSTLADAMTTQIEDRIRKSVDLESVWNSFAHMASLVDELQRRVERQGKEEVVQQQAKQASRPLFRFGRS